MIEISLMESLLDFQFELFTTYYASNQQPKRSYSNNGHSLLRAPYGVYKTADGYIALAMMDMQVMAKAIDCSALENFSNDETFVNRDEIKTILAEPSLFSTNPILVDPFATGGSMGHGDF